MTALRARTAQPFVMTLPAGTSRTVLGSEEHYVLPDPAGPGGSLAVGDGTGSPTIALSKSPAGAAGLELRVGATVRGKLAIDGGEALKLAQHDAAGAEVGALSFNATTGAASLSKALTIATGGLTVSAGGAAITGDSTVTGALTVGALTADGALTYVSSDLFVVGVAEVVKVDNLANRLSLTLPTYADETAAKLAGLAVKDIFVTPAGVVTMVVTP